MSNEPEITHCPKCGSNRVFCLCRYPIRRCRTLHVCCLCGRDIRDGQRYHDGGLDKRAHVECVASRSDLAVTASSPATAPAGHSQATRQGPPTESDLIEALRSAVRRAITDRERACLRGEHETAIRTERGVLYKVYPVTAPSGERVETTEGLWLYVCTHCRCVFEPRSA